MLCGRDAYRNVDLLLKCRWDGVTIATGGKEPAIRRRGGGLTGGSSGPLLDLRPERGILSRLHFLDHGFARDHLASTAPHFGEGQGNNRSRQ